MEKDIVYYVWLSLVCGPASPIPERLLSVFDSAESIYSADADAIDAVADLPKRIKTALGNKDLSDAQHIVSFCVHNNVGILTIKDRKYPSRLKRISTPPLVLYYRGNLPDFDNTVCIAVVGTRSATDAGRRAAYELSRDLSLAGVTVVSGMAYGIDAAAAEGAVDVGGHTVAVFGCGIDVVYPAPHELLMNRILVPGAVITEYPPHEPPKASNFPIRNRIISGLCQGTVVVEADFKSGALITAKYAGDEGRDIFAVPGNISSPTSYGPNLLIKEGARIVTAAEDIIMEYASAYPFTLDIERMKAIRRGLVSRGYPSGTERVASGGHPDNFYSSGETAPQNKPKKEIKKTEKKEKTPKKEPKPIPGISKEELDEKLASLDDVQCKVYALFAQDAPLSADDLCSEDVSAAQVLSALTMLEIEGLVEAIPGGLYRKKIKLQQS